MNGQRFILISGMIGMLITGLIIGSMAYRKHHMQTHSEHIKHTHKEFK